jgi:hypothetical protein
MKAIINVMDNAITRLQRLKMSANFFEGKLHFFDGVNDNEFDEELVKDLLCEHDEDLIEEFTNWEQDEDGLRYADINWQLMEDFAQFTLCNAIDKLITDKKL